MNSAVSTVTTRQQIASAGVEQVYSQYAEVSNQGLHSVPAELAAAVHYARQPEPNVDVAVAFSPSGSQIGAQASIRTLSERLCGEHPAISTYEGVFGGIPHLKGIRISVADILEQLYLTGSISGVKKIYSPDVSEEQIKEAIAYAQDFVETALCPLPEVDG